MTRRKDDAQLGLFGPETLPEPMEKAKPAGSWRAPLRPAPPCSADLQNAAALPENVRLGTSSWSFPGWEGTVYNGRHSTQKLARDGLSAYAQHPLFRTVGIDRTYYGPISTEAFAAYAADVPAGFRFLVKAPERCTLLRFPDHPRYGDRRGQTNDRCLDPAYAIDKIVAPFINGLGNKAGPLLFQFPPQSTEQLGAPLAFADHLHAFLDALPRGPLYAVEVRNPALLTPRYRQALADVGAVHCANAWGWMPEPQDQGGCEPEPKSVALVVRWMLRRNLDFNQAKTRYSPFTEIVDADLNRRANIAKLISDAIDEGLPVWVIVNNKAEGCAPLSIAALAAALTALRKTNT